jgi:ABC-2 type transport system ATP-binding protein
LNTNHVIVTEQLSRKFGSFVAVDGVSLSVPEGVVYAFLGPNGAGKTTTIRMILGLIAPTSGCVYLFGRPFSRSNWQRMERVGTLVESPSLYLHLTGRENLEVIRRMLNIPKQNIDHVLGIVNLQKAANKLVRQYSLGMQQRLALALAMLNNPVLLVLDEPTNGLDPSGIHEIRTLIREMPSKTGATVFLSSHLLSEVEQMATHAGIIHEGKLLFEGGHPDLRRRWKPVLRVTVDRAADATKLLLGLGWQVQQKDGCLEIHSVDETASLSINRVLMQHGFLVRQLALHQPGLEEIFLELTQAEKNEMV